MLTPRPQTAKLLTTRLLAVAALTVLLVSGGAAPASAAEPECPPDAGGECSIGDHQPGGPGSGGNTGGGGNGNGGGTGKGSRDCRRDGVKVPCHDDIVGWFNSSDGCYYKLADPQPSGGPAGQSAYIRTCTNASDAVWLADPPGGFEQRASPLELAYDALATIRLGRPVIEMAPDPDGIGLVGLPVWLWTPRTEENWGPNTASAGQAGIRVTISAEVSRIDWDMGDGTTITCTTPGTPYTESYGAQPSPDCGYAGYRRPSRNQPGGEYTVTATTHWRVPWSGGGASGVITQERESTATIRIDELQVVTR